MIKRSMRKNEICKELGISPRKLAYTLNRDLYEKLHIEFDYEKGQIIISRRMFEFIQDNIKITKREKDIFET